MELRYVERIEDPVGLYASVRVRVPGPAAPRIK